MRQQGIEQAIGPGPWHEQEGADGDWRREYRVSGHGRLDQQKGGEQRREKPIAGHDPDDPPCEEMASDAGAAELAIAEQHHHKAADDKKQVHPGGPGHGPPCIIIGDQDISGVTQQHRARCQGPQQLNIADPTALHGKGLADRLTRVNRRRRDIQRRSGLKLTRLRQEPIELAGREITGLAQPFVERAVALTRHSDDRCAGARPD